jgi:hypothetical protein
MAKPGSLGIQTHNASEPRSVRQMVKDDELLANHHNLQILVTNRLSPASQALYDLAKLIPGSAEPSPGAKTLSASFAGSVEAFPQLVSHLLAKTLSETKTYGLATPRFRDEDTISLGPAKTLNPWLAGASALRFQKTSENFLDTRR